MVYVTLKFCQWDIDQFVSWEATCGMCDGSPDIWDYIHLCN
jgi:hypothetical protein